MEKVRIIKNVKPYSQYEASLSKRGIKSACGPTAIATIINYYSPTESKSPLWIRRWYTESKTGWFGLSSRKLIHTLSRYGTARKIPKREMWEHYIEEIDHERPVAVKFDQWFSFKWFSDQFEYRYHWVTGIGYQIKEGRRYLMVLDHGKNKSALKRIHFDTNRPVLTMVSFIPYNKAK